MAFDWERLEELDKAKSRVMKYVLYKKRTEHEVRQKFENEYSEDILDEVIDVLMANKYMGDEIYIERAMEEFMAINTLSIKEMKYKLASKGLASSLIDNYISDNYDKLREYEVSCAKKILLKKSDEDPNKVMGYLMRKGYKSDLIKEALAEI